MKTKITIVRILSLSLLGFWLTPMAEAAIQPRTDINPALLYWQAFSVFPELNDTNRLALYQESSPERLSRAEIETAKLFDTSFKFIRRASRMTVPCDWGVSLSDGPEMVTPNVVKLRIASVASLLRARVALSEGRTRDAIEEIKAVLTMARSTAKEELLVQVMIQVAIEESVIKFLAATADMWSPSEWNEWESIIEGSGSRVTTAQAVVSERRVFHEWLVARFQEIVTAHPDDDRAAFEQALAFWRQNEFGNELVDYLRRESGGTGTGLMALVRRSSELYRHMAAVGNASPEELEARKQAMAQFLEKNPLSQLFAPNMAKARSVEMRLLSRIAMVQAMAAYRNEGMAGYQSVRDPYGAGPFRFERKTDETGRQGFTLASALTLPDIETELFFSDPGNDSQP